MNSKAKKRRNALIATGLVAGSIIGAILMLGSRKAPPRAAPTIRAPSVVTAGIQGLEGPLKVRGSGTVRPKAEIDLAPQVGGRVSYVSPSLVSGGRVAKGELLVRLEDSDYANAVLQARAQVAQDSVSILQALEEARIAEAEYRQFLQRQRRMAPPASALGAEPEELLPASPLTLREPQVQAAEASLARSEAQLADAELALSRIDLRSPFDGVVRSESVDVGAYANPGQSLARLLSTEEVEVKIPLSDDDASLLPGIWESGTSAGPGLPAVVLVDFGQSRYRWNGYVHRVEAALDEETRTIDVVVRVSNPFQGGEALDERSNEGNETPPLLIGQFVDVEMDGRVGDYLVVPRTAVRPGNEVWVVDDGTIRIVPVQVLQLSEGQAFVAGALEAGQRVVVEGIDLATEGMTVQDMGEVGW
ncbi:MAG: efflux RND transporter periplasmic adaptor subunit [Gemmatimonadota bacterium]|jgi:RND family efflux transporter MFP subunit